jgi:type I restriction enzyme S subunit
VCGPALRPEYLLYAFRSMGAEFNRLKMGSTHNTIYMPDIQAMRFALPPLVEQDAIVDYVRREAGRFDALIGEAERAVTLLEKRRAALISAAVTGQIDVRAYRPAEQPVAA